MPRSPLHDVHAGLGARFVDFGGWEMPVQYEGVIAEHLAVRQAAGVFDVSHLGRFSVAGPGSTELLRTQLCNDITNVGPGRAQYTMALNGQGGVEDDIIVWRRAEESYWVMPNGTNATAITGRFTASAAPGVEVESVQESTVLLAVQGPDALALVSDVLGSAPKRFRVAEGEFAGHPLVMAGTGYTGERGAEVAVPAVAGDALWRALSRAGAVPCGLGARDTLRLEMGYPLWGQDLDPATTPLEAGLEWVVDFDHEFVGRDALVSQRDGGVTKTLIGFAMEDRRIPRRGYPLRAGGASGEVTSGNYSPVLEQGIGMGYVSPAAAAGDPVEVEVRGTPAPARRMDPPFVTKQ